MTPPPDSPLLWLLRLRRQCLSSLRSPFRCSHQETHPPLSRPAAYAVIVPGASSANGSLSLDSRAPIVTTVVACCWRHRRFVPSAFLLLVVAAVDLLPRSPSFGCRCCCFLGHTWITPCHCGQEAIRRTSDLSVNCFGKWSNPTRFTSSFSYAKHRGSFRTHFFKHAFDLRLRIQDPSSLILVFALETVGVTQGRSLSLLLLIPPRKLFFLNLLHTAPHLTLLIEFLLTTFTIFSVPFVFLCSVHL